jgi:DNA polymerase-1
VDFLALMGDKIDDIPGVPGIGKKTASELLARYGDLDGVLSNTSELKGKRRQLLEDNADQARMSQELATIDQHVPLDRGLEDLRITEPDPSVLNALHKELEFYSLISEEERDAIAAAETTVEYETITDLAGARTVLGRLFEHDHADPVAVVPVHDVAPPAVTRLVGLAISIRKGTASYISFHGPEGAGVGRLGLVVMKVWLQDRTRAKVAHDVKALWLALRREGVALEGPAFDVRLASFLVDPTEIIPHRLGQIVRQYLQLTVRPAKSVIGSGKKQIRWSEASVEAVGEQACRQADLIKRLHPVLAARVEREGQTAQLIDHDQPLSAVLGEMEFAGIKVDPSDLQLLGEEFREIVAGHERRIHEIAGHEFNIRSTKQLSRVLFEELGLPVIKRTKTGYSTNVDVLNALDRKGHEIARELLEHRKFTTLINTYTDVLAASINPATGRIHTCIHQTTGATGRLITTDPDLQRTPIHTPEGRRIRQAFIPEPGHKLISADWSQIELRVLAHISRDAKLIEAFENSLDVHAGTAAQLFDVPLDSVTREQRNIGKTINFATIYGQGATALAQILQIPRKKAQAYIEGYFEAYAGVRDWVDATVEQALKVGYVETLLGRRRYIPELSSNNFTDLATGKRIAANTPIQGTAADICKEVMLQIPGRLEGAGLKTRMLLQIHDELLFEAPDDEVEAASAIIRERMENVVELAVPLVVDLGVGMSWAEAH